MKIKQQAKGDKPKKRWEKSITTEKGSKTITVREVENGYIVCKSMSKDTDEGYEHDSKEYISKENPIKDMEGFEEFAESSKKEETDLFGGLPYYE